MTGKNKVERWITVEIDDSGGDPRDLSGDIIPGSMTGLGGKTFDEVEMTGVSEEMKNFLAGHWSHEFSAQFSLNDLATTGSYTVFKGIVGEVVTVNIEFGSGAAPTTNDPQWDGEYLCVECPIVLAGNKPALAARFVPSGATPPDWGTV